MLKLRKNTTRTYLSLLGFSNVGIFTILFSNTYLQKHQGLRSKAAVPPEFSGITKQLSVDKATIDESKSSNYKIQVNPPTVLREIIATDKPWEKAGYHYYTKILL